MALWGLGYIWRTSFHVDGRRYFGLLDDSMISMAYARNFAEGRGLVWNIGNGAVEGFSHPLWMLPMIGAQWSGLSPGIRPVVVQLVSLLILVALPHVVLRLASGLGGTRQVQATAVAVSAAFYPLAVWSLLGMETGAQALLLAAAAASAARSIEADRPLGVAFFTLLALGLWLRMDSLVGGAALLAAALALRPASLRDKEFWRASAVLGIAVIALFAWRLSLYGELLPNTYFLKLTGVPLVVRLARGTAVFRTHVLESLPLWLAFTASLVVLRRHRAIRLLAPPVLALVAYNVWVGGDVWDRLEAVGANRFLSPGHPLMAVTCAIGAGELLSRLAAGAAARRGLALAAAVVLVLGGNGMIAGENAGIRARTCIGALRPTQTLVNGLVVSRLIRFDRGFGQRARAATVWAGWPAYLFPQRHWFDLLGYNDRRGARAPAATPLGLANYEEFTPGHVKWDYRRAVNEEGVDGFFQVWPGWFVDNCEESFEALPSERSFLERSGFACFEGWWMRPEALRASG